MSSRTKLILKLVFWVLVLVSIIMIPEIAIIVAIVMIVWAVYKKARHIPMITIKRRK